MALPFVDERTLLLALALVTGVFFTFWGYMNYTRTPKSYGKIGKKVGAIQIIVGVAILYTYFTLLAK